MAVVEERADWSTAFMNDLPDSSFLYIESGGSKDSSGKTTPRTLRHFPYKDASGKVDLPHLRNALSRIPQSSLPSDVKASLTKKAQGILAKQGSRAAMYGTDVCANCGHEADSHGDDGDCGVAGCDCTSYDENTIDHSAGDDLELRYAVAPITHVDVRDPSANDDGTWTMSGYAAVFNQQTTLYDGKFVRTTEDIAPGAFNRVLREQEDPVHFNYGHDMGSTVAATDILPGQPGSLQLREDANGLFFLAKVAKDDPDGLRMASKMRTGVLKQASFAFQIRDAVDTTTDLEDGRQNEHRRITDMKMLRDVCATPIGAYRQTVSQLRSYAAAIGQPTDEWEATSRQPDFGGELVSRASGSGDERRRALAQMMRDAAKHRKVT